MVISVWFEGANILDYEYKGKSLYALLMIWNHFSGPVCSCCPSWPTQMSYCRIWTLRTSQATATTICSPSLKTTDFPNPPLSEALTCSAVRSQAEPWPPIQYFTTAKHSSSFCLYLCKYLTLLRTSFFHTSMAAMLVGTKVIFQY